MKTMLVCTLFLAVAADAAPLPPFPEVQGLNEALVALNGEISAMVIAETNKAPPDPQSIAQRAIESGLSPGAKKRLAEVPNGLLCYALAGMSRFADVLTAFTPAGRERAVGAGLQGLNKRIGTIQRRYCRDDNNRPNTPGGWAAATEWSMVDRDAWQALDAAAGVNGAFAVQHGLAPATYQATMARALALALQLHVATHTADTADGKCRQAAAWYFVALTSLGLALPVGTPRAVPAP